MSIISIIIPVYNVGKYLDKCLSSIQHQSFVNFEVYVINDASTDNSLDIINNYVQADDRFTVLTLEHNGGLFNARKEGFKRAQGDYIITIDGDDFIALKALEILYKTAITYDVDMVEGRFLHMDNVHSWVKDYHNSYKEQPQHIDKMIFNDDVLLDTNRGFFIWNRLFKRSIFTKDVFKKMDMITEHLILHEDILYSHILLPQIKSYYYLPLRLWYYVQQKDSSLNNFSFNSVEKKLGDEMKVKKYLKKLKGHQITENQQNNINLFINHFVFLLYTDALNKSLDHRIKIEALFEGMIIDKQQDNKLKYIVKRKVIHMRDKLFQASLSTDNTFMRDWLQASYGVMRDIIKYRKISSIGEYYQDIVQLIKKHSIKKNRLNVKNVSIDVTSKKVVIFLTCDGTETNLSASINSILEQNHRNIELILWYNGENDITFHILEKYNAIDSRIKILDYQTDCVLRNTPYELLRDINSDYVMFFNANDILEIDGISYLLKQVLVHGALMVNSNFYWIKNEKRYNHFNAGEDKSYNDLSKGYIINKRQSLLKLLSTNYPCKIRGNLYATNLFSDRIINILNKIDKISIVDDLLICYLLSQDIIFFLSAPQEIYGHSTTTNNEVIQIDLAIEEIKRASTVFSLIEQESSHLEFSLIKPQIIKNILKIFYKYFYKLNCAFIQEYLVAFKQYLEYYYRDSPDPRIKILNNICDTNI